ncbi:alpha-mannosidase [Paenibacillus psychroresistens]|uniref:Alpha-mannosidase n=1 Tax=Paenibacillus psychroresistens TaxID=1778678 RepID=A0A6B8RH51_9BACL|nr:alpha-mannosidase [Paenibacillus psychroresistens]QGQ95227.1 alpha-mannosidase [Paenibacillus psychroresistens]
MEKEIQLHMIGNAHLDPVWLWQWQEGYAEIKATFRSALDRMNEFPEFIFTCAGAAYYQWIEQNAPEMFEEIHSRVKEGRWVIVGGWWIQPDCNIPAGESFVRHGLYSQRYFQEKFGVMAKVGYNVDSFGHHNMLPQILKKSGMDYYVYMRPEEHEKSMERNLFWWESLDGSRVMTFRNPISYNNWNPKKHEDAVQSKALEVLELAEKHEHNLMCFYGVGNHGGGPTIANLQSIQQLQDEHSKGQFKLSSPNAYFKEMELSNPAIPVFTDDLQHHASGCYSAHSETKALNRRAEHRLLTAEKFSTFSHLIAGFEYPATEIRRGWNNVMFNQFHDIMGGCSIKEAFDDSRDAYGESLNNAAVSLNAALQKISWSIDTMKDEIQSLNKDMDWQLWEQKDAGIPVVVFNPLSWKILAPIQINKRVKSVTDADGEAIEYQIVRGSRTNVDGDKFDTLFMGRIPAMGYKVFWIYKEKELPTPASTQCLLAETYALENNWYRLEIEPHTGHVRRLYDKQNKVEVLSGKGAVPIVIDEHHCDTWAHGVFEFRNEIATFSDAQVTLLESGPLRAKIRVTNRYNHSVLQQDFMLYRDKPGVEVKVKLDWHEKHKMLKLSFPVHVTDPKATYEIPYGYIERPVNGEEEPGQQWLDVTGIPVSGDLPQYGLTLFNDSKYSFDVKDNDLRMTVVRSPIYADHYGERDDQCEFMDQGVQEFRYALASHVGDWRNAEASKKAYELNVPPIHIIETYHKGILPQIAEGIQVTAENLIVTVFKKSEDGNGYILRFYETNGQDGETDLAIPALNRKWTVPFTKCEIKTLWIPIDPKQAVTEVNMIEMPI